MGSSCGPAATSAPATRRPGSWRSSRPGVRYEDLTAESHGRPRPRRPGRRWGLQTILRHGESPVHLSPSAGRQRRRPHPLALCDRLRGGRPVDPGLPDGPGRRVRWRDPLRGLRDDRRRGHRRPGRRRDRTVAGDPAEEPRRLHGRAHCPRRGEGRGHGRGRRCDGLGWPSRSGRPRPSPTRSSNVSTAGTPRATASDHQRRRDCRPRPRDLRGLVRHRQPAPVRARDHRDGRGTRGGRRRGPGGRRGRAGQGRRQAGRDRGRGHPRPVPGSECDAVVRRADRLDAHVLAGQDVDRRASTPCSDRCSTCIRSSTGRSRGTRSTWTS